MAPAVTGRDICFPFVLWHTVFAGAAELRSAGQTRESAPTCFLEYASFCWTLNVRGERIMDVPTTTNAARLSRFLLLAIAAYFCCSLAVWAQTSDSQSGQANKSWTTTTESNGETAEPLRTIETHTQSGNRTLDKQLVQRRAMDGGFVPYQDIEKETVQVDDATVRTTTRTFAHDADGGRTLVEVVEEEKHTLAGGDSKVVRSTSDPDVNGDLQVIRRQIEETQKLSPNVEDSKTTVLLPDVNGGLAPAVKVHERREQGANGTIDSQETTRSEE